MITLCRICGSETSWCRYIDLYVMGSEGLVICHDCEMLVVEFVRTLIRVAATGRKIGYQNAKEVRKSLDKKNGLG